MKVFQFKRGAESWPAGENLVYPDDQLADPHGAVRDRTCPRARSNPQRHRRVPPHPGLRHGDADSDEIQRKLRRARRSYAMMSIRSVYLLDATADPDAKTITWAPPHPHEQLFLAAAAA